MRTIYSLVIAALIGSAMNFTSLIWAQSGSLPREAPVLDAPLPARHAESGSIVTSDTFRADRMRGMKVRNPQGEDLGTIEDLVMDLRSHQARYAAVSYRGFLGGPDRLFCIPFAALRLKFDGDQPYFIVDVDKEILVHAPGFARHAWPDFANRAWTARMEAHYGRYAMIEGTVNSTSNGQLQVTDLSGTLHTFDIGPRVQIVTKGASADFRDLRPGQPVTITTTDRDGQRVATVVDFGSEDRTALRPLRATAIPRRRP